MNLLYYLNDYMIIKSRIGILCWRSSGLCLITNTAVLIAEKFLRFYKKSAQITRG